MLRVSSISSSQLKSFFTGSLLICSEVVKQHYSISCHRSGQGAVGLSLFPFGCCSACVCVCRGGWVEKYLLTSSSRIGDFPEASAEFSGISPAVSSRIQSIVSLRNCQWNVRVGWKIIHTFAHLFSLLFIIILCHSPKLIIGLGFSDLLFDEIVQFCFELIYVFL